jgi:hypothetical protein
VRKRKRSGDGGEAAEGMSGGGCCAIPRHAALWGRVQRLVLVWKNERRGVGRNME